MSILFPERVPKNIAATYVKKISESIKTKSLEDAWVCTTDIKTFYDKIQRDRLLHVLKQRINCNVALSLIIHALNTPIVPKNTSRKMHSEYKEKTGVPQGLAISNILASIYMAPVDDAMEVYGVEYYRYVDDVIMLGDKEQVYQAFRSLRGRLKLRGLGLHSLVSGKSQIENVNKPFGYLGYLFKSHVITVRDSTVERFVQSIAGKFSDFRHNKNKMLQKYNYLTEERVRDIFMMELNERITGAVKDNKRYGWIAYFSQITDLSLLYQIDHIIETLFKRMSDFGNSAPSSLKKLSRSYWEIKFNTSGGYIRDYDKISTITEKLHFLNLRGRVGPNEMLNDEQISWRFDYYVNYNLSAMQADESRIY